MCSFNPSTGKVGTGRSLWVAVSSTSLREPVQRHKVNYTWGGALAVISACTFVQAHPLPVKNQQELEDHCSPQRVGKNRSLQLWQVQGQGQQAGGCEPRSGIFSILCVVPSRFMLVRLWVSVAVCFFLKPFSCWLETFSASFPHASRSQPRPKCLQRKLGTYKEDSLPAPALPSAWPQTNSAIQGRDKVVSGTRNF